MIEVSKAKIDEAKVDWGKGNGLLPAIVQDAGDGAVLMLPCSS
jgi:phosphoribosyl-AMP cyclohydrolase